VKRVAVLASGGGTNFEAILDYLLSLGSAAPCSVVLVASDRPQAGAIEKARAKHIEAVVLHEASDPTSHELETLLASKKIDLVALAGYLKLVPAAVVDAYAGRIVNVHPSLLPAFGGPGMYGLRVHQGVINAHEKISGATVHYVTHEYDRGPMLAQWPVPVLPTDDAERLAARVLAVEHALYPRVLAMLAAGKGDRFPLKPDVKYYANPPVSADGIAGEIDALLDA
jgi:formyltetrahydrofolate-dependent phosphoribosylglycinamide formyltransferase